MYAKQHEYPNQSPKNNQPDPLNQHFMNITRSNWYISKSTNLPPLCPVCPVYTLKLLLFAFGFVVMSAKIDDKRRLKVAAQGLRKTAISLQAAVVSLLQTADALSAETDENLVENNPLDVNLQDFLKGDINSTLIKLLNNALNGDGEALDDDQKAQQNGKRAANGVKKSTQVAGQVKAENPDKQWPEIVHLISARWKGLQKEEKEIYEHRFEEAKQTYETELKTYMEKKNKDQVVTAVDPDGVEENNDTSDSATPDSESITSQSDEEDEEDIPNPSNSRSSRSKKKPIKRKTQEDDDDESAHEEEQKKSKKKASNEEGEVQKKKIKKSSREEKDKKKKNKRNRQD
ncbi:unnamed protein product [Rhizophagus irregularis]|nr:unnamed protein product [Rhizophagus irregularis]